VEKELGFTLAGREKT